MRPPTIHWSIENQRNKPLIYCNPISSCVLECICVFSRTYFSGTSVSFNLAALPSSNKHQSLHLQCCYCMGSWDNCGCIEFTILLFAILFNNFLPSNSFFFGYDLCFLLAIRTRLNRRVPAMDTAYNRQSVEHNTELSKTLFIVIAACLASGFGFLVFYFTLFITSLGESFLTPWLIFSP